MVVCPRCGYPYMGEAHVISEREVSCSRCEWSGNSADLLNVDPSRITNPQVFDELFVFLAEQVGPVIGRKLLQLGLVQLGTHKETAVNLSKILHLVSKAILEVVVKEVLGAGAKTEDRATIPSEG